LEISDLPSTPIRQSYTRPTPGIRLAFRREFEQDPTCHADLFYGRHYTVISERKKIKRITLQERKKECLAGETA
jgi:hypothetical protein